ncbi:MAG: zinc-ribbon domain-containing protein [Alphaproteobacteria bacterium]|nr:zinc-ribbon domain-containing protein [Alphaproteobacteria bacterium]
MLITCPKCRTTYNVPSLAHHPDQKVRCVKCGHVWEPASDIVDPFLIDFALTEPIEKQEQAMPLPTFQDFFKEPEKKSGRFLKWLKPLYFISLFCIAASIYLFFFHPPKHMPVTLQTLSYEVVQEDYKTYLLLQAAAFNNTDQEIHPETFTVRFVDKNNRTLTTTTLESPVDVLPPHGVEKINIKIERPPSKTAKVFVMLTKMQTP